MRWHWIRQRHNPRLLLFFNGWGMDERVVAHLECDDEWDVLMACDYRDLKTSEVFKTSGACLGYEDIVVVCWSMGVWAYACVSADLKINPARVIAINGTPLPIHAEFGIAPDVYQTTLDDFGEAGREKFFKRMCGSPAIFERFDRQRPQRELSEQAEELAAIRMAADVCPERAEEYSQRIYPLEESIAAARPDGVVEISPAPLRGASVCGRHVPGDESPGCIPSSFQDKQSLPGGELVALISKRDRIMPTANQQRYWTGRARCELLDAPHYPFFLWTRWTDILWL